MATAPDAPPDTVGVLFFGYAMFAAIDWLYSLLPVRFPELRLCMSEGGIGWVAGLMARLDHMLSYHEMYGTWQGTDLTPAEVLSRNFWFCAVEDPSAFVQRERIGVQYILLESDYPHCDSTWPNTQRIVHDEIGSYLARQRADRVAPTVVALRERAQQVVDAEVGRLLGKIPDADDRTIREIRATVERVVDKLLHAPTVRVKELAEVPGGDSYAEALRELFALDRSATEAVARAAVTVEEAGEPDGGAS